MGELNLLSCLGPLNIECDCQLRYDSPSTRLPTQPLDKHCVAHNFLQTHPCFFPMVWSLIEIPLTLQRIQFYVQEYQCILIVRQPLKTAQAITPNRYFEECNLLWILFLQNPVGCNIESSLEIAGVRSESDISLDHIACPKGGEHRWHPFKIAHPKSGKHIRHLILSFWWQKGPWLHPLSCGYSPGDDAKGGSVKGFTLFVDDCYVATSATLSMEKVCPKEPVLSHLHQ